MKELLNPRNDFLFKRIFGVEENEDLLVNFINAVLEDAGEPLIRSATVLNPEISQDALMDKRSVLDIRARSGLGQEIDIEVQIGRHDDIAVRTVYYWAKLFEQQLRQGSEYAVLRQCITINALDFRYLDSKAYHTTFHIREDRSGAQLTDVLEIHFVELPKLMVGDVGTLGALVRAFMQWKEIPSHANRIGTNSRESPSRAGLTFHVIGSPSHTGRAVEGLAPYSAIHGSRNGWCDTTRRRRHLRDMGRTDASGGCGYPSPERPPSVR